MTRLARILSDLQRDLAQLGASWALVGGMAVSVRTEPRFTRDIDIAIIADRDTDAETLVFALSRRGYAIVASVEQTATGRLATARLAPPREPEGGILVDLIFASSGVEAEVVAAAENLEILPDITVPVCKTAHLLVLKILARDDETRPQDQLDLRVMIREMTEDDWAEAANLAGLVGARGFARGRDLKKALDELQRSAG